MAFAQDCAYRPWMNSVTPFTDKTFADVEGAGTGYDKTLRNNWDYYAGIETADPPANTPPRYAHYRFLRETHRLNDERARHLLVQYYEQIHNPQAREAVIAIHGSGLFPDAWFRGSALSRSWGANYTNYGGTAFHADGYDVYAPFVTHHSKFSSAGRRVAAAYGDEVYSMDVRRIMALYSHLKKRGYARIHLAGVSYGGWMSILAAKALGSDPVRGTVLAIEGWIPSRAFVEMGPGDQPHLWTYGWEETFSPSFTTENFLDLPKGVQLAYGTCNSATYAPWYSLLPRSQVIIYKGAHEFLWSVWREALDRTR
jgi:pimeloyl-ACP methyl ester carboxylesterase